MASRVIRGSLRARRNPSAEVEAGLVEERGLASSVEDASPGHDRQPRPVPSSDRIPGRQSMCCQNLAHSSNWTEVPWLLNEACLAYRRCKSLASATATVVAHLLSVILVCCIVLSGNLVVRELLVSARHRVLNGCTNGAQIVVVADMAIYFGVGESHTQSRLRRRRSLQVLRHAGSAA